MSFFGRRLIRYRPPFSAEPEVKGTPPSSFDRSHAREARSLT